MGDLGADPEAVELRFPNLMVCNFQSHSRHKVKRLYPFLNSRILNKVTDILQPGLTAFISISVHSLWFIGYEQIVHYTIILYPKQFYRTGNASLFPPDKLDAINSINMLWVKHKRYEATNLVYVCISLIHYFWSKFRHNFILTLHLISSLLHALSELLIV